MDINVQEVVNALLEQITTLSADLAVAKARLTEYQKKEQKEQNGGD